MKQILHILLKDVRHFRIEILITLAIMVAQVWLGPAEWAVQGPTNGYSPADIMRVASILLLPLMLIAWALLIARIIQEEGLVGDRQFWLTRPYSWKKLLAAKLIFLALFLYLPFFLLQCILLAEAGFSPFHWIPRILLSMLLISAAVILPLIAIASVTSSFGRMVLVLVGVLFYFLILLAVSALQGQLIHPINHTAIAPLGAYLDDLVTLLACVLALILQYGARRTLLSRLVLVGALAVSCAIGFIDFDRLLMNRNYPRSGSQIGVPYSPVPNRGDGQVQVWVGAAHVQTGVGAPGYRIAIPLRLTGIVEGSAISVDRVSATFEGWNGDHWTSGWQTQGESVRFAQDATATVAITMPDKIYSKFHNATTGVRLALATTELKAGKTIQMKLVKPMQEFSIPGVGICKTQAGFWGDAERLACRFPFKAPLIYVTSHWSDQPCSQLQTDPGWDSSGWLGTLYNNAPSADFFPVQYPAFPLPFSMQNTPTGQKSRNLCPGTPVTFTPYELVRRMQTTINWQGFHL
jgi:hypothetical protein